MPMVNGHRQWRVVIFLTSSSFNLYFIQGSTNLRFQVTILPNIFTIAPSICWSIFLKIFIHPYKFRAGLCVGGSEPLVLQNAGNFLTFWVTVTSHEGLCCMKLISYLIHICKMYTVFGTSWRVHYHQIMTWIVMSLLESYNILFLTYCGNQNCSTEDLTVHIHLFFHKVAYLRYDIPLWRCYRHTISARLSF